MIDIEKVLKELAKKRPVFHSEADFQHALAWEIRDKYQNFDIRLEQRLLISNEKFGYIDLILIDKSQGKKIFIELKYKTKNSRIEFKKTDVYDDEIFELKNHTAHTDNKKLFYHDIDRLEYLVRSNQNSEAYAIFLTNSHLYYKNGSTNCLHTYKKDTIVPKSISSNQNLAWLDYSAVKDVCGVEVLFKCLVVKILK
ncbi:hypothetical protein [Moraxella sp. VT-16-12]|uniref:hypothetical protein n=1 Tax=Moraxella sp. VT-16-12 TaxID=2014877 RepID=UPI000B7CA459|nr:hypothetical protein [Moraxella sp. VT-16-12]TWV83388.1 hypothetical protein CEW93_003075 [Moraxella sp. VT-16-12]